jgi:hypothetical protein
VVGVMLRVARIDLPPRTFTAAEIRQAFAEAEFGSVRIPGRQQIMDAHELRGLFQSYLFLVGATLDGPDGDALEVPERAAPVVEALRRAYLRLLGDDADPDAFHVTRVPDP